MIRSLFIGFLILSALTTRGAEAQIVVTRNISTVVLKDLFGTISSCAENAAGSSSEYCRISGIDSLKTLKANLSSINSNSSNEVFIMTAPSDGNICLMRSFDTLESISFRINWRMHGCTSGLSPPILYDMSI